MSREAESEAKEKWASGELPRMPNEPLRYPRRVRRFFGTYGTHTGAPCLWDSLESALENADSDERVYEFRIEMIREVPIA